MKCARCGFDNPPGFGFCGQCGQSLKVTCPTCGAEVPPGFAFCGQCGTRLAAAPPAPGSLSPTDLDHLRRYLPLPLAEALQFDLPSPSPRLLDQCFKHLSALCEATAAYLPADLAERLAADPQPGRADGRFLHGTLLFADISGFTAMSEKLSRIGREGAEEITGIVNRYLEVMVALVRAHGGQLIKFGGDALLGFFPELESASHAAQAALQMQAAMGEFSELRTSQGTFPLRMKVGLHRGRFFAAQLGNAGGMEYALFGAAVNATAATESAARAGEVLLDEATLAAIPYPHRAVPSESAPGYFIIQHIEAPAPTASNGSAEDWFALEPNVKGLRRAAQLLDTLSPYLPAGLLSRLVTTTTHSFGLEGEHRLVAVLFANVHGLGALCDRLGPGHEPAITAALNQYYLGMAEAIGSFGGVINKIDLYDHGDKLMALFGAPVAHEDDAERAVRAALAMQSSVISLEPSIINLSQHVGVNFGNVFAGYVGTRARREYSVMGDTVNLAARLMSVAEAGQIVVSHGPRRKLGTFFHFTPRGSVALKGKAQPVPIFTVEGVRSAAEATPEREELRAPLVGRDSEWKRLRAAAQILRSGGGQIISLIGEAGLGKSRLVDELQAEVDRAGEPMRWVEGRCLSYTESVSYAPMHEWLRQLIGVRDEEARARLQAALAEALPAEDAASHFPYLANFLNLRLDEEQHARVRYLDAEALQRRTFVAIGALIESLCRPPNPPLMLVIEDLHWIDQASRALLEYLMALVSRVPLGLLLAYRPERTKACWQVREKAAREYAPYTVEIELGPLAATETQALLNHLVPMAEWPERLAHLIGWQTEGNPLYLEELLRSLIDQNVLAQDAEGRWQVNGAVENLQVPDSLEGVMMTRLDRLDEPSRNLAQVASVIGRTFGLSVLAHVTADKQDSVLLSHLLRLQQHEIAQETQRAPERVYTFNHGMMQEVCYSSLLARVRRQVHRQVAEHLEARTESDEGLIPVIAHHAFFGQDWPHALHYQTQAGQQAQRLFANSEAMDHFSRALQSAEALPAEDTREARLGIHLALGELLTVTAKYDRADEHLAQARRLAAELGDVEAQAKACRWYARLDELRGDFQSALRWVTQGLTALKERETAEAAQLHLVAGLIHARRGEREPAQERGHAAAAMAEKLGELSVLASANLLLGLVRWQLSDTAEAVRRYHRALELYQRAGDLAGQAKAQNNLANAYFKTGQWKEADEQYRRARATFDQIGAAYNRALAENNLGGIALNQGRVEEAVSFYQQALSTVEKIGASAYVRGTVHMNLGAAYIRQQRAAEAREQLAQSRALFEQTQSRDFWPELHRHLARAALIAKDLPGAEAQAGEALRAARELGMRGEEGNALRVLGEIALDNGQPESALEPLRASVALLAEVADDYELARSQFSLARALGQLDQATEARAALEAALRIFERLDATMDANAARGLMGRLAQAVAVS